MARNLTFGPFCRTSQATRMLTVFRISRITYLGRLFASQHGKYREFTG